MTGFEAFVAAVALTWILALLASSARLVRAQTPQEHDAAMRMLTGCIIGGIIIVIGPEVGMWITGLKTYDLNTSYSGLDPGTYYYTGPDVTSPAGLRAAVDAGRALPTGTGRVLDMVIGLLRIIGGLVVVAGLLWGGISLRAGRASWEPSKFAGFAIVMLLVLSVTLLAVGAFVPLAVFPFAAWPLFFFLDAASTRRIYLRSPQDFERVERNRVFVALVRRVGVVPAFPAFLALAEIPIFVFISLVIAPALGAYIFGNASIVPCLSAGAGVMAFTHAQAWGQNRGALKSEANCLEIGL